MTDKNTSKEAARFIVYYDRGVSFPPTHLILGHGYQEVGRDHRTLARIYGKEVKWDEEHRTYAGYITVVDGRVHIYQGGSNTLGIRDDDMLNRSLRRTIKQTEFLHCTITSLFPLIIANQVPHVMFAI